MLEINPFAGFNTLEWIGLIAILTIAPVATWFILARTERQEQAKKEPPSGP